MSLGHKTYLEARTITNVYNWKIKIDQDVRIRTLGHDLIKKIGQEPSRTQVPTEHTQCGSVEIGNDVTNRSAQPSTDAHDSTRV